MEIYRLSWRCCSGARLLFFFSPRSYSIATLLIFFFFFFIFLCMDISPYFSPKVRDEECNSSYVRMVDVESSRVIYEQVRFLLFIL
jgi:hypothetical protein